MSFFVDKFVKNVYNIVKRIGLAERGRRGGWGCGVEKSVKILTQKTHFSLTSL